MRGYSGGIRGKSRSATRAEARTAKGTLLDGASGQYRYVAGVEAQRRALEGAESEQSRR